MGQNMILTIGALVLFGVFLVSSYSFLAANSKAAGDSEYYVTAFSLAESVIDEAKTKAFDEKCTTGPVLKREGMSAGENLGPDGGSETVPTPDVETPTGFGSIVRFDDIDDYNNYRRTVNTPRGGGFDVQVRVAYGKEVFPDSTVSYRTFCKRMDVTVSSPLMSTPVTISYAFVY
jgi:hypothetical protein